MSLRIKAVKGFSWTVLEGVFSQGIIFIVGIILARLLAPSDFGIIGIISAFITISNSIVEGGFGSAIIRKIDSTHKDYNTVFFSNLIVSLCLYCLLIIFSSNISSYFNEPLLGKIFVYSGLILIINSFSIIQKSLLIKALDFKTQAVISVISSIIGGIIAVLLAYDGYGVWSLVALSISRPFIGSALLWLHSKWRPSLEFSRQSFSELFNFGYKLLAANLINTLYKNIYYILIGKYFSPTSLGHYTRADQFQAPFSSNITLGIRRISFPIFSSIQNDNVLLKRAFIKFLRFSVFINFTIMLTIAGTAKPLVLFLIGEKWYTSIYFLQLLCIPGMFYPLQILNLNLLTVKGYSNLNLKLEIVKKIILIPLIYTTVFFGIEVMLYGLIVFSIVEYLINSFYTNRIIDCSILEQVKEIAPFFFISVFNFIIIYLISFLNLEPLYMLLTQLASSVVFLITINEILRIREYMEVKEKIFLLCTNFFNRTRK